MLVFAVRSRPPVSTVPEKVQQRTQEQQDKGQDAQGVRSVLGDEKEPCDRQKGEQHPSRARAPPASPLRSVFVIHVHVFLLAARGGAVSGVSVVMAPRSAARGTCPSGRRTRTRRAPSGGTRRAPSVPREASRTC